MAEQADHDLQKLGPEQQAAFDCAISDMYAMLADAETRIYPGDVDVFKDEQEDIHETEATDSEIRSGHLYTAEVVVKQAGKLALLPARAYWGALKWGYRHVTEER